MKLVPYHYQLETITETKLYVTSLIWTHVAFSLADRGSMIVIPYIEEVSILVNLNGWVKMVVLLPIDSKTNVKQGYYQRQTKSKFVFRFVFQTSMDTGKHIYFGIICPELFGTSPTHNYRQQCAGLLNKFPSITKVPNELPPFKRHTT